MRRITATLILTIVTSIMSSNALAQRYGVQATVPFDFTVNNKTLPSGTYKITSPSHGLVLIRSNDGGVAAIARSSRSGNESKGGCKLIFNKYGDQYFLNQILSPNEIALNVVMPTSKLERKVRRREVALKEVEEIQVAGN